MAASGAVRPLNSRLVTSHRRCMSLLPPAASTAAASVSAAATSPGSSVVEPLLTESASVASAAAASSTPSSPVFAANAWEFGIWNEGYSLPLLNNLPATVEVALRYVHDVSGLPWWASIAILGVSMRACVFPLTLRTMKTVAVIKKLQPFLKPVQDEMREAQQSSDLEAMKAAKAKQQALMSSFNVSTAGAFGPMLLQAPIFMSLFFTLRAMADPAVAGFEPTFVAGGLGPFFDLTACDPTFPMALPILTSLTFLGTIEAGGDAEDAGNEQSAATKAMMKNFMRGMALVLPFLIQSFPAAVFMFWIPNNTFSLCQTLVLKNPNNKALLGIADATVPFTEEEVKAANPNVVLAAGTSGAAAAAPTAKLPTAGSTVSMGKAKKKKKSRTN